MSESHRRMTDRIEQAEARLAERADQLTAAADRKISGDGGTGSA